MLAIVNFHLFRFFKSYPFVFEEAISGAQQKIFIRS